MYKRDPAFPNIPTLPEVPEREGASCFVRRYDRDVDYPPLIAKKSWTINMPYKYTMDFYKPSETIGNFYYYHHYLIERNFPAKKGPHTCRPFKISAFKTYRRRVERKRNHHRSELRVNQILLLLPKQQ